MLTDKERASITDFYGRQIETMAAERIRRFLTDKSIGFVELGNERGFLDVEIQERSTNISVQIDLYQVNGLPDAIKIKRLDSSIVPGSVIESFNRHIWYSRYCLTDIHAVSFSIADRDTFGLYIEGYVDDSWDNSISAWELYEANGNLICSLIKWNEEWRCKEGLITNEDFGGPILPPPYTPNLVAESSSPIWIESYGGFWVLPVWSENEVRIIEP
jgi:hypothetical protein